MELGKHLRELFRLRIAGVVCVLLGVLAAISMSYKVSFSPPSLEPRAIQIASATSEVLVDTPLSSAVDLRQGSADFEAMTARATLLGNVIASPPVIDHIAREVGVPPAVIRAQAPLTPDFPRPIAAPGEERAAKDLLRIAGEYRINIQVDPSVPILRVIAQAPTARSAEKLADSSISGLKRYLDTVAVKEATPIEDRVRLEPLGRGEGVVVNGGIRPQASAVAFLVVFGLSAGAAVFFARVRRGWRETSPQSAGSPGPADERLDEAPALR